MDTRRQLGTILCLLLAFHSATAFEWNYEFGVRDLGKQFYRQDGEIGPVDYRSYRTIPAPPSPASDITYVKVTVWALSPPKVDFDVDKRTVSIIYTFGQIPISTYQIQAYGKIKVL